MSSASKIIQAAAGNAAGEGLYVEEIFSTYLYEGNGSTQTITNDIDLDGEGGLVWIKNRDATDSHILTDTERGATEILSSDSTAAEATDADTLTAFNSDGFAIGADVKVNTNTEDYASWTFRKAPKFFDVVTWTSNDVAGREIAHNLGSVPGCIIVKNITRSESWAVYHRGIASDAETDVIFLDGTSAATDDSAYWNDTEPTSSNFTVGVNLNSSYFGSPTTYVAYLFAHNDGDGDFGEDGDQDIIKCGSYTGTGSSGLEVDLGFEPQWLLVKRTDASASWFLIDNMRGFTAGSGDAYLLADSSQAETTTDSNNDLFSPQPSGFKVNNTFSFLNASGGTYIYIAIRRGPMKTPESGTEVFDVETIGATNGGSLPSYVSGFPVDMLIQARRDADNNMLLTRLLGETRLFTNLANAEGAETDADFDYQDGAFSNTSVDTNRLGYMFRRAPGFFDVVAYTGTGSATTISHNLGVVPELIIVKNRDQSDAWQVYAGDATDYLVLNTNAATADNVNRWNDTAPTDSVFTIGTAAEVNTSTEKYIAYLFATLPGVSKVGSYTGTGSTAQAIDCGFSNGARFVLIKRSSGSSQWFVFDTERGITSTVNDGVLYLNSTNAEQPESSAFGPSIDGIQPDSSGFKVQYSDLNASGETFIFLAIA